MAKQMKKAAKKASSKIIKQGVPKKTTTKKTAKGSKIIKQGVAKKTAAKKSTGGSKIIKEGVAKQPAKKNSSGSKIIKQGVAKKAASGSKIIKQGAPKKPTKAMKKAAPKKAAIKRPAPPPTAAARPTSSDKTRGFSLAEAGMAILDITFRDVGAGLSNLIASLNGEEKTLNASGIITFHGVQKDDIIGIDGSSAGSTEIRISLPATPQQMNFSPGNFNDNFIIS